MFNCKLIHHGLEFEVEQSGVVDIINIVPGTKDGKQWLVVQAKDQVLEAKDEEFAFIKSIN